MPQNTTAGRQRAGGELWWQQNLPQHPQAPERPAQIWHSSSAEPRCFWDTGTGKEGNEESLFNGGIGGTQPRSLWEPLEQPPPPHRDCSHFCEGGTVAGAGKGVQESSPSSQGRGWRPPWGGHPISTQPWGSPESLPTLSPPPCTSAAPLWLQPCPEEGLPGCHLLTSLGQRPWLTLGQQLG